MSQVLEPVRADVEMAHQSELAAGERFAFGANWRKFLDKLSEERIVEAVSSLKKMLGVEELTGKRFLDIGSGSGLFSLAAYRLGAHVTSFDYDGDSVGCTKELRRKYGSTDRWEIHQGSILDKTFLNTLATQYDVVYSWGVLHHTGSMWEAISNSTRIVAPGGIMFIAIYNDQGAWSERWKKIKRFYCSGRFGRMVVAGTFIPYWVLRDLAADIVWLRNPIGRYRDYVQQRGMSVVHDWHDWLGGYPFEVAKPEEIIMSLSNQGFRLTNLVTAGGSVGCVEYVFRRES